jgi:hypothetical protein
MVVMVVLLVEIMAVGLVVARLLLVLMAQVLQVGMAALELQAL